VSNDEAGTMRIEFSGASDDLVEIDASATRDEENIYRPTDFLLRSPGGPGLIVRAAFLENWRFTVHPADAGDEIPEWARDWSRGPAHEDDQVLTLLAPQGTTLTRQ
jgi:hypothetical protein